MLYGCCGCSQIGFYELKMLLKMMQACLLWKVKLHRFLHAFCMFPLKTLRELCRILHTPGMNSFFKDPKILDLFFARPKTSDGLAIVCHRMDVTHVEVACAICIFCV